MNLPLFPVKGYTTGRICLWGITLTPQVPAARATEALINGDRAIFSRLKHDLGQHCRSMTELKTIGYEGLPAARYEKAKGISARLF